MFNKLLTQNSSLLVATSSTFYRHFWARPEVLKAGPQMGSNSVTWEFFKMQILSFVLYPLNQKFCRGAQRSVF